MSAFEGKADVLATLAKRREDLAAHRLHPRHERLGSCKHRNVIRSADDGRNPLHPKFKAQGTMRHLVKRHGVACSDDGRNFEAPNTEEGILVYQNVCNAPIPLPRRLLRQCVITDMVTMASINK